LEGNQVRGRGRDRTTRKEKEGRIGDFLV